jgi:hypothetical protein
MNNIAIAAGLVAFGGALCKRKNNIAVVKAQ